MTLAGLAAGACFIGEISKGLAAFPETVSLFLHGLARGAEVAIERPEEQHSIAIKQVEAIMEQKWQETFSRSGKDIWKGVLYIYEARKKKLDTELKTLSKLETDIVKQLADRTLEGHDVLGAVLRKQLLASLSDGDHERLMVYLGKLDIIRVLWQTGVGSILGAVFILGEVTGYGICTCGNKIASFTDGQLRGIPSGIVNAVVMVMPRILYLYTSVPYMLRTLPFPFLPKLGPIKIKGPTVLPSSKIAKQILDTYYALSCSLNPLQALEYMHAAFTPFVTVTLAGFIDGAFTQKRSIDLLPAAGTNAQLDGSGIWHFWDVTLKSLTNHPLRHFEFAHKQRAAKWEALDKVVKEKGIEGAFGNLPLKPGPLRTLTARESLKSCGAAYRLGEWFRLNLECLDLTITALLYDASRQGGRSLREAICFVQKRVR